MRFTPPTATAPHRHLTRRRRRETGSQQGNRFHSFEVLDGERTDLDVVQAAANPRQRMQLLVRFLAQWGNAPKKNPHAAAKLRQAKQRLGGVPDCLEAYFSLGIDRWLQAKSSKFEGWLDERWFWHSTNQLQVNEKLNLLVIGSAGPKVILFGIRPRSLGEPDPQVMTHLKGSDWPFGTLSETLIRECVLNVIGTLPASRLHVEKGQPSGEQHPIEQKANSLLEPIPVVDDRRGQVELYAGSDVLFARRFAPASVKCDLYVAGRSAADKQAFLEGKAPITAPKPKPVRKRRPAPKPVTIKTLRKNLKNELRDCSVASATDFIADSATPCIRLKDDGEYTRPRIAATRIGGHPDLPAGFDWPVDSSAPAEKNALLFLGQINFSDLPTWTGSPFPRTGLLSLFVGGDGFQGSASGFCFSSRKKLTRTTTPTERLVDDFDRVLSPMRVSPVLSLSIPAFVAGFQQEVIELCQRDEEFDEDYLSESLKDIEEFLGLKDSCGQVGGYAVTPVPTDYHDQHACAQLRVNGYVGIRNSFDVSAIKNKRTRQKICDHALSQQVLLSLDSSNSSGAMWSDAGILYLVHEKQRIADRDFASVPTFIYH